MEKKLLKIILFLTTISPVMGILPPLKVISNNLLQPQALAQNPQGLTGQEIYNQVSPAVVTIVTKDENIGSGFIITQDGLILTNAHVIEGSTDVIVIFKDGTQILGKVIALGNPENKEDLAVIEIKTLKNLPVTYFAPSTEVNIGEEVYALGNPFGRFPGTFTKGIVSNLPNLGLIQHDASINPGNSGGPLLNRFGNAIGVNTALYNPTGEGVNIGISVALDLYVIQHFLRRIRPNFTFPTPPPNNHTSDNFPQNFPNNPPTNLPPLDQSNPDGVLW